MLTNLNTSIQNLVVGLQIFAKSGFRYVSFRTDPWQRQFIHVQQSRDSYIDDFDVAALKECGWEYDMENNGWCHF